MDLSEISRTVNVWAHFLNLEPPSLHTCTNSRQTYVLFTRINYHHYCDPFLHTSQDFNNFLSTKISTSDQSISITSGNQSTIHRIPSQATSYIPRYYHKFPAYCTTSCAPRHRFLTQQIPKVILLQRSAIKIQLSS